MTEKYVLITVIICALCTQATRWLPFLLFGGKKEVPRIVRYLGAVLPAAIIGAGGVLKFPAWDLRYTVFRMFPGSCSVHAWLPASPGPV